MRLTGSIIFLTIVLILSINGNSQGTVEHVGSALISPDVTGMAFTDELMLCSGGHALKVFDISNADSLRLAYGARCQTETERIFIHNGYVYVTSEYGYPQLYNIDSDGILNYLQDLDWDCPLDIFFKGDTAYVATCWSGFHIYDITDPENPSELGSYYTMNSGFGNIVIIGNYAVLNRFSRLEVFDITDPSRITKEDSIETFGGIMKSEIEGNNAIVLWEQWYPDYHREYGLTLYDISNLPYIGLEDNLPLQYPPSDFHAESEYIYLMDGVLRIFWTRFGYLYEIGAQNYFSPFISGDSNKIYLANSVYQGDSLLSNIAVLDAAYPDSLILQTAYRSPSGVISTEVEGDYAYSVCWPGGLAIVDISNPLLPITTGQYQVHTNSFSNNSVSYPYVFMWGTGSANIIDVSNPFDPALILEDSSLSGDEGAIMGDYAYIASGPQLKIVDISIPSNPILYSSYSDLSHASHVCVSGNYAFVSDGTYPDNNVKIINISDPYSPTLTAQIDSLAGHIAVDGQYLYLGSAYPTFLIFDISDPANPRFAGSYGYSDYANAIAASGDYVFLATDIYLYVLDVSDRAHPRAFDGYYLTDIEDLHVIDDYIYAAAKYSLEILRFTPTGIEEVGDMPYDLILSPNYPNPFNAQTTIKYSLPKEGNVRIDIFDIMGRKVETLVDGMQTAGEHQAVWNAENNSSGIYFYRLKTGDVSRTERCVLLK
jgi:hypothetical protein